MLPDFSQLWLHNAQGEPFFSEVVVPLLRTLEPAPPDGSIASTQLSAAPRRAVSMVERREAPGSQWVYLKLYVSTQRQDEIIGVHMGNILRELKTRGLYDKWFYIRYFDPEPHLRLRFHAIDQERSKEVLVLAVAWSQQLAQQGLIGRSCVDTYEREIERYGGPQAIDCLEQAFHIDSEVVSSLITSLYQRQLTLDPLFVAVMSLDALSTSWGLTLEQRLQQSQCFISKNLFADEFRPHRKMLCELLAPWNHTYDPSVQPQREQMRVLLSQPYLALQSVVQALDELAEEGLLQQSILQSLAHMHVIRLLGVNRDQELKVYAFWHHALKSITLRPSVDARQA
jgi:thiopeptide-type bacteriocin biosynthesis protein